MYTSVTAVVARCKTLSVSSVEDAKHNMVVVCIALLHAVNSILERLHLDASLHIVLQAEQHLRNLLQAERYLTSSPSSAGDEATITSILLSAWAWLHDLAMSVFDHVYAHMTYVPGVSRLVRWIQSHLTAAAAPSPTQDRTAVDTLTAIVLSYTEKDVPVSSSLNHRIQRSMHYPINLKPFDATVQLQTPSSFAPPSSSSTLKSPQSMPASPTARLHWQSSLASLSQNVLYQVRDQLRAERAATLTGTTDNICIVKFNRHDCHAELQLSCGAHAVTKVHKHKQFLPMKVTLQVLPGLYRTVRATAGIPVNKAVSTAASTYGVLVHRGRYMDIATFDCVQVVFTHFDALHTNDMVVSEQCELRVPSSLELFPTVTLDSMHHTILSRFAATDLVVSVDQWALLAWQYPAIYTLDGTLCSAYKDN
ncbi:hypothetical protein DYB35_005851 [Aphanomyces astaci]|uniref:Uncharacterized protein n=1 Tax=Aphanomyces astaci TaxID=112090 RepID=A0A3R7A9V8_APHAT|nr:hypothetical protein DYB35_005851 [Aphanomyces astaci]